MKTPILIPGIFNHPFTYLSNKKKIKPGEYVKVSFGKKEITGVTWLELEHTKKSLYKFFSFKTLRNILKFAFV